MNEELKPCQLCGSKAFSNSIRKNGERICCTNLKCQNRFRCATIKEWNEMTDPHPIEWEIERLRKALIEIWDLTHNKQNIRLIDALIEIDIVIKQALEEVNDE